MGWTILPKTHTAPSPSCKGTTIPALFQVCNLGVTCCCFIFCVVFSPFSMWRKIWTNNNTCGRLFIMNIHQSNNIDPPQLKVQNRTVYWLLGSADRVPLEKRIQYFVQPLYISVAKKYEEHLIMRSQQQRFCWQQRHDIHTPNRFCNTIKRLN